MDSRLNNLSIPKTFEEKIISAFGGEGRAWLSGLPRQVDFYLSQWKLKISGHFDELSFNFVLPVERENGSVAVLKLGLHPTGRLREIAALKHFAGNGSIKVLDFDQKTGVSLLERALPGKSLKELFLNHCEEKANQITCSVISRIQSNSPPKDLSPFKSVEEWGKGFAKILGTEPNASRQFDAEIKDAQGIFLELIRTTNRKVVLHADLHHTNVLSCQREDYIAIDPKGMFGDPAYELGTWIRNPMPDILNSTRLEDIFINRIYSMSDALKFDRKRVWGWAYSQAWLAAIWALEDKSPDFHSWVQIAKAIGIIRNQL